MTGYDRRPHVQIGDDAAVVTRGWPAIVAALAGSGSTVVECYPGAPVDDALAAWRAAGVVVLDTRTLFRSGDAIAADLAAQLTGDRVFGRFAANDIADFFDRPLLAAARAALGQTPVVVGPGAAFVAQRWDRLVHISMARWELQQRQRRGDIASMGCDDAGSGAAALYKRAYFVDWRVGDRVKAALLDRIDAVIDANADVPQMIAGDSWRAGLAAVAARPFRVVPFFDPGPWGGQWMREKFALPEGPPNYAWCFDCVPEENSLLLRYGDVTVELPALDVVLAQPVTLLGAAVFARFGAEFPIRFDLLDTMGGGNLSLQVHPRADFARDRFGLGYTQDESYYLLAAAPDGHVYLGLRDDATPDAMATALRAAQAGDTPFDAARFVNVLPAKAHDHFLIPAGTVHCSGAGAMVLEVSATPYIFTFKLWDWGRLGLDGRPRPIHLDEGLANIDWTRRSDFVTRELVNAAQTARRDGRLSPRAHRAACAAVHRNGTGVVLGSGAVGDGGQRQCAQPRRRRGRRGREPDRRIRALRGALCRNVHRAGRRRRLRRASAWWRHRRAARTSPDRNGRGLTATADARTGEWCTRRDSNP